MVYSQADHNELEIKGKCMAQRTAIWQNTKRHIPHMSLVMCNAGCVMHHLCRFQDRQAGRQVKSWFGQHFTLGDSIQRIYLT